MLLLSLATQGGGLLFVLATLLGQLTLALGEVLLHLALVVDTALVGEGCLLLGRATSPGAALHALAHQHPAQPEDGDDRGARDEQRQWRQGDRPSEDVDGDSIGQLRGPLKEEDSCGDGKQYEDESDDDHVFEASAMSRHRA